MANCKNDKVLNDDCADPKRISVVTPVYNRQDVMHRSLQSSLSLVQSGAFFELVVVDDGSSDGTLHEIESKYADEINSGQLKLIKLQHNAGVSAAKNAGAMAANGDWIVFMDSDDWFVVDSIPSMLSLMQQQHNSAVLFFRCQDQLKAELIGRPMSAQHLTIRQMVNSGTPGECLPVVKRDSILRHPYPSELRGSEGLSYLAMLSAGDSIFLSDLIVREYQDVADNRLSSPSGLRKRAPYLVKHNLRMMKYWRAATFSTCMGWVLRVGYYSYWSIQQFVQRFFNR